MKSVTRFLREKTFGLTLAALAIVAGIWGIYRFGPRPEKATVRQEVANQPMPAPAQNRPIAPQALGSDLFSALFKSSISTLASGRSGDSPEKYIESLEAIYRSRGYQKLDRMGGGSDRQSLEEFRGRRLKQIRGKVYWRTEAGGVSTIAALGEDADPRAKTTNVQKQMYLTAVNLAEGGGSQWTTYRYMADNSGLAALNDQLQSGEDWPGQDPPDVPRPSGLRRLISVGQPDKESLVAQGGPEAGQSPMVMVVYQSQRRAEGLAEWYTKEMPLAGWSLNPQAGQSREKTQGVLYFIKGHRSCLVWINSGAGNEPTSVIISARAI
ncbi:MAG: hypothetical protein J2P21_21055 [Chloracidobacterium sp.]|nr:hypothetical protein [Chloracidobacterium sp.]